MITVLRLDHRLGRDTRITTHVCLTARAFGADKVILSGERDKHIIESVESVVENITDPGTCANRTQGF